MLFLGIIGQYMAKMYLEVKGRPVYIVAEESMAGEGRAAAEGSVVSEGLDLPNGTYRDARDEKEVARWTGVKG